MKIAFYDSGLGGLSLLKLFLDKYPSGFDLIYLADSARAPYGDKSPEELIKYIREILDFMQSRQVDLVISACNTSSMYLDQVDLSIYDFQVINLFEIMQDYFKHSQHKDPVALLATVANINSAKYLEWSVEIFPVKCPELVPLVEDGRMDEAKAIFQQYLNTLGPNIHEVIIGCTHYAFLLEANSRFLFINPAQIAVNSLDLDTKQSGGGSLEILCTGNLNKFNHSLKTLLSPNYSAVTLPWNQA